MKLTMAEAIDSVFTFCYGRGCWESTLDDHPEAKKFIEANCTERDAEYGDLIILNAKGVEELRSYLEKISLEFIGFLKKKGRCPRIEAFEWFGKTYGLKDIEVAEDICEYILRRRFLENHGYKAVEYHDGRMGRYFELERLNES